MCLGSGWEAYFGLRCLFVRAKKLVTGCDLRLRGRLIVNYRFWSCALFCVKAGRCCFFAFVCFREK